MSSPQLALVTGGNRGLGEAVATRLAELGYRVLVGARDAADGERVAEALRGAGGRAEKIALDVTNAAQRDSVAERLQAEGARLDVLVNNAGIYEGPPERVLAVNLHAPLALTERLIPLLSPGARVVMVSSGLGSLDHFPAELARRFDPPPDLQGLLALLEEYLDDVRTRRQRGWPSAYSVSKAALNVLTRILAERLGERARVNAVSPGWVRTRMGGPGAPRSIDQGMSGIVWAATLPPDGPTGGFFMDGARSSW